MTLTFAQDRDLEGAFTAEYERASVRQIRFSLLLAAFLYGIFGFLDSSIIPDIKGTAWLIRYAVFCPCTLGVVALSFWPAQAHLVRALAAVLVVVAGLGIILMIVLAAAPGSYLYYAGLMLTCAYAYIFMRLRFVVATPISWGLVAVYACAAALIGRTAPIILVNNLFFLIGINIIGMASCYVMEHASRTAFLDKRVITERTRSLQVALVAAEEARRQAEMLAQRDPLTNLYNRRHFFRVAQDESERSERHRRPLSMVMLDIDHFKAINDRWGHAVGDRLLTAVAHGVQTSIRSYDVACRYGGEEFLVMLPETDTAEAVVIAQRLRAGIANQVRAGGQSEDITVSVGVASLSLGAREGLDSLIDRADQALYRAKEGGRDQVVVAAG